MSSKTSYTGSDYRKKRRKLNSPTDMHAWRTTMMVVAYVSIFIGGTLPLSYWAIMGFSENGMQYTYQAILFAFLIWSAIVNFIFGWRLIKLHKPENYSDAELIEKHYVYLAWSPVLMISGAFVAGILYIALWRTTGKRRQKMTWTDSSKARKAASEGTLEVKTLDSTLKTKEVTEEAK